MKLNPEVVRLITVSPAQAAKYTPMELKESILKSEGRVIMGQELLFHPGISHQVTGPELMFAFGADMVMLNTFDLDHNEKNLGLQGMTLMELKEKVGYKPIGIYMGCPAKDVDIKDNEKLYRMQGMLYSKEHLLKAKELGADFIILGGNPGSGTSIKDVIAATKEAKELLGDDILLFSGKWEDGIVEKVLGDPLADYDSKEIIKQLIDAGADVIDLPAPGSRHGITVEMIRELVEFTHRYKPATLAMCFLNSSVEMADIDTIREISLMMKQTGADIHAIGDGGFGGSSWPENIYQMSVTMKGKQYTWLKMAKK